MTISELKDRMSRQEFGLWYAYIMENGPLNQAQRIEAAIARAVSPFLKNVKPSDMMPWPKEQEAEATPESLFTMFQAIAATNRRKAN